MRDELFITGGNSNHILLLKISAELKLRPARARISRFPDGEVKVEIEDNVRGKDVFVIQSLSPPANDYLMELLIMIDALRRASAERITAVIPYFGYARQDRKHKGRVPITARLVANLIETAGADRILVLDLHASQIQGFFNIPVDHLPAYPFFVHFLRSVFKERMNEVVIVAPDAGSIQRAGPLAREMNVPLAVIDKRRIDEETTEVRKIIGDVRDKIVLLADDIISTGGTLIKDAHALGKAGAREIYACATHGIFAGNAGIKLDTSPMKMIYITDSVSSPFALPKRLKVVSIASQFAEVIKRIHENRSVSEVIEHT